MGTGGRRVGKCREERVRAGPVQPPPRTRVGRPPPPCRRCQAPPVPLGDGEPWAAGTGDRRGRTGPPRPARALRGVTGPLGGGSGTGGDAASGPPVPEAAPPGAGPGPERAPEAAAKLRRSPSFPRRSCGAALVVGVLPFGQTPRPGQPGQNRGQRDPPGRRSGAGTGGALAVWEAAGPGREEFRSPGSEVTAAARPTRGSGRGEDGGQQHRGCAGGRSGNSAAGGRAGTISPLSGLGNAAEQRSRGDGNDNN